MIDRDDDEGAPRPPRRDDDPEEGTIMTAATELTTRAFADAIGTDPKTLRRYLRASTPRDEQPGKGGRWVLPGSKSAIAKHRKAFAAWQADEARKQQERAAKAVKDADAALATLEDSTDAPDAEVEGTDEEVTETE